MEVEEIIGVLNRRKSYQKSDIPTKIIKLNSDIFSKFLYKHFKF